MNFFSKAIKIILNFFFPPQCVFCDKILEINTFHCVCDSCLDEIRSCREMLCCQKCGKPVVSYGKRHICYFCTENKTKYFDRIVSVFKYDGMPRDSVLRYKHGEKQSYGETYAQLLGERIDEEYKGIKFDLLCGVPSHTNKNITQGFDNVGLICKKLSRIIKVPYAGALIRKKCQTLRQTGLSMQNRLNNLKDSMEVCRKADVKEKTILLVDDVCTTRATIIECSRALKAAGAKRVYAVTLCTTTREPLKQTEPLV